MYTVLFRLFLKIFSFFFLLFFLIFHFVLGYKYHPKAGFIKSENFLIFKKRSDNNPVFVKVNSKKIKVLSSEIVLYNLSKGLYYINFGNSTDTIYLKNDDFVVYPLVSVKKILPFNGKFIKACEIAVVNDYNNDVRKLKCRDFLFVKYNHKLFVCNEHETYCRYLLDFTGTILGYNDLGLVFVNGNKFYNLLLN